ncbi:MAG: c-type cytochrome [Sphingobacteriaceae bacterium]|nr:MAG: c-type cytochrome [Sphingobacteriaceae bacterium]
MKFFLRFLVLAVLVTAVAAFSYLKFFLPDAAAAPNLKIVVSPAGLAHGKYLANHVMLCVDCHSTRNQEYFAAPMIEGTLGKGGEKFNQQKGFPGSYVAQNITPAHLGSWTDGEIFRALTSGVSKSGKALFPVMPYLSYGKLDREDIYDVIAYIRTLKSIPNETAPSKSDFPMSLIINTMPQKAAFTKKPAVNDVVAYGKYMITAAACADCHTPQDKGKQIAALTYAGGMKFDLPGMTIQSANITPDRATGIGNWTEQQFVARFKAYDPEKYPARKLVKGDMQSVMPWTMFAGMDTTDLKAIYQYLKTIKPINHRVEKMVVLAKN